MQRLLKSFATLAVVVLLGFASAAGAHGHDGDTNMEMAGPSRPTIATASDNSDAGPQSYFQYGEHSGLLIAHILLMILGWMFILPIGK